MFVYRAQNNLAVGRPRLSFHQLSQQETPSSGNQKSRGEQANFRTLEHIHESTRVHTRKSRYGSTRMALKIHEAHMEEHTSKYTDVRALVWYE